IQLSSAPVSISASMFFASGLGARCILSCHLSSNPMSTAKVAPNATSSFRPCCSSLKPQLTPGMSVVHHGGRKPQWRRADFPNQVGTAAKLFDRFASSEVERVEKPNDAAVMNQYPLALMLRLKGLLHGFKGADLVVNCRHGGIHDEVRTASYA